MTVIEYSNHTACLKVLRVKIEYDDCLTTLTLKDVELEGDDQQMLNFSRALRGHPSLEEVNFDNVTCVEKAVDLDGALSMLVVSGQNLQKLSIKNMKVSSAVLSTVGYSSLKQLEVINCGLDDASATALAGSIANMPSLQSIDLTGNNMTDLGCLAFTKVLEKNLSLHVIKLDGNNVSTESQTQMAAKLRERVAQAA